MDVFPKYFRRLLTGNSPQIFPGINKVVENAGNYPLLVQEMTKVSQDLDQARKIAETIDASEGDIFRDFDLATFLYHFQLDPLVKIALALAFTDVGKPDLRAKGEVTFRSLDVMVRRANGLQPTQSYQIRSHKSCRASLPFPTQTRTSRPPLSPRRSNVLYSRAVRMRI